MKKNVVRALALVLVALMCLSLVPLAAHAEEHVHNYEPTRFEPTCSENGYIQMYCEACGDGGQIIEYIPPTGLHSFINVESPEYLIHEGDCEHAWQYWKSCSVCLQSAEEAYNKALDEMYDELNNRKNSGEEQDWETVIKNRVILLDEKYKFSIGGEGHHYVQVEHQEATCTSDGWKDYTYCDVCNEYFNYEAIPAKGHRWGEYTLTKAPTCTENGEQERVCEVCEAKETLSVPALGHTWGEFSVTKAPTCTENGEQERVCSVCGAKDTAPVPALGHTWGAFSVTKAPTCTEEGTQERVCSVCGAKDTASIPALGHRFGEFKVTKPATCTVDGEQEHVCTVCGFKETEVIPAAHKWGEFVVIEEPGCYASGTQERTCSVCGEKQQESIPAAHKYGEFVVTMEPTCYSSGEKRSTCTVCGDTHVEWIDMVDHKYENGVCVFCGTAMPEGYAAPAESEPAGEPENNEPAAETPAAETEGEPENAEPVTEAVSETPENLVYIHFDGNGATGGSMADQGIAAGSVQALNANAFTREGYEFLGWDVAADGSAMGEDRFLDGEEAQVYENVTLYAQWKQNSDRATVGDLSVDESAKFDLGVTKIEIQLDGTPVSEAKVGDLLKVKVTPDSTAYHYQWYRIVEEGKDPVLLSQNSEYELQDSDATYHVNCSVYEDDPQDALSADNSVRVRLDVPFPVTVKGLGTVMTSNEDKLNYKEPVTITYDPNGETPNPFNIDALTENEVSLTVTPSSGYLIRYVKENATTVIPASRNAKSYTINSVQPNQKNHRFEVYFDNYEIRISAETAILPSDISTESNSDIKQSFMDAYVNKLGLDPSLYSAYYYVTPCWKGNPAAPISDTDLSAIGSFNFSLDMPAGVTPDNYDSFEIHVYHYVKKTNTWENVTFTPDFETEPGKVKAKIANFSNFSPFAIVALPSVKLEYDSNGGSGSMEPKPTQIGNKVTVDIPQFTPPQEDQTFDKWIDSEGKEYKIGEEITLTENLKLIAQWKTGYTILFDANDSKNPDTYGSLVTGTMNPLYVTADESVTISNQYHLKNHEQLGWSINPGANNTPDPQYSSSFTPEGNLKLYAVWKRTQISITFNPNDGGSGNMPDQPVAINSSVRLNSNAFTAKYSNQEFAGWSVTKNGNIDYKDQQIIDVAENDFTLWAVWRDKKNIHFLPGKGTGAEYIQPFSSGVDTELDALSKMNFTAPEKSEFDRWNNKADGTGDVFYGDGDTITNPTAEIYLFAQWKTNMYDVTFVKGADGASGTMATQTITNGTPTNLTKNAFTYPKYEFTGWKDQHGVEYTDEQPISSISENLTLTAQWKRVVYDVTFVKGADGASGTMEVQSIRNGTSTPLTKNAFTYTGYRFKNWKDQHGVVYTDEQPISAITEDLTLTAQWEPIWTIKFDSNHEDASGTMEDLVFVQGVDTPIPESEFTRTNFEVIGWTETEGGTTPEFGVDANAPQKNTTLYAVWQREKIKVTLDNNNDSAPDTKELEDVEKALSYTLPAFSTLPNTFTYPNRTFINWNTVKNPTDENPGTEYEDEDILPGSVTTKDFTLYAQWDYAITYVKGAIEAKGDPYLQTFERNKEFTLDPNEFTYTNHNFIGWLDEEDNPYSNQQKNVTLDKSHTFTAQWEKNAYSVFYVNPDDGDVKSVNEIPTSQKATLLPCPFEAKPGMIFGGWLNTADGKIYQPGDELGTELDAAKEPKDLKLTAVWKEEIKVYFYPGDGSYESQAVPKGIDTALTSFIELGFTAPEGQTFAYWENNYDSTDKRFDKEKVNLTSDLYLTAVYGETINLIYNANGGTLKSGTQTGTSLKTKAAKNLDYLLYTENDLSLKRSGYEFLGWALGAGADKPNEGWEVGNEPIKVEGGFPQDTTIYAVWKQVAFEGIVTITGSVTDLAENGRVGETLTADVTGETEFFDYSYQWLRDGMPIDGATNQTYVVTADDYDHRITCRVTAAGADPSTKDSVNYKDIELETTYKEIDIVDNAPEDEDDYFYGLTRNMSYTLNSTDPKDRKLVSNPSSNLVTINGVLAFQFTKQGTYRFYDIKDGDLTKGSLIATVEVRNWFTLDYEIINRVTTTTTTTSSKSSSSSGSSSSSSSSSSSTSGSGTVQIKNGSTTLSASSNIKDKSGNVIIKGTGTTSWHVREGASTDLKMTVRPASSSYGFVYLNGSQVFSTNSERTMGLGTLTGPEHYEIVFVNATSSPKTADMSRLGLWSALSFASFVGLASILVSSRKRKKQ